MVTAVVAVVVAIKAVTKAAMRHDIENYERCAVAQERLCSLRIELLEENQLQICLSVLSMHLLHFIGLYLS